MKGFELNIKGQKTVAGFGKGNVHIMASRTVTNENEITHLVFSGLNSENNERSEWYKMDLEIGDEFTVKIIEVSNNSKPIKKEKINPDSIIAKGKLRTYYSLKKELEKLGLI